MRRNSLRKNGNANKPRLLILIIKSLALVLVIIAMIIGSMGYFDQEYRNEFHATLSTRPCYQMTQCPESAMTLEITFVTFSSLCGILALVNILLGFCIDLSKKLRKSDAAFHIFLSFIILTAGTGIIYAAFREDEWIKFIALHDIPEMQWQKRKHFLRAKYKFNEKMIAGSIAVFTTVVYVTTALIIILQKDKAQEIVPASKGLLDQKESANPFDDGEWPELTVSKQGLKSVKTGAVNAGGQQGAPQGNTGKSKQIISGSSQGSNGTAEGQMDSCKICQTPIIHWPFYIYKSPKLGQGLVNNGSDDEHNNNEITQWPFYKKKQQSANSNIVQSNAVVITNANGIPEGPGQKHRDRQPSPITDIKLEKTKTYERFSLRTKQAILWSYQGTKDDSKDNIKTTT